MVGLPKRLTGVILATGVNLATPNQMFGVNLATTYIFNDIHIMFSCAIIFMNENTIPDLK